MLRIERVTDVLSDGQYKAEDFFGGQAVDLSVSAKLRLLPPPKLLLEEGDECVAVCSPYEPARCRLTIPSHFKMDDTNDGWKEQDRLRRRYTAEIGPYDTDRYWVKKADKGAG